MYYIKTKPVYAYGPKLNKFGFRGGRGASLVGHFKLYEYDEQLYWTWEPLSHFSVQPSPEWLYWNMPQITQRV